MEIPSSAALPAIGKTDGGAGPAGLGIPPGGGSPPGQQPPGPTGSPMAQPQAAEGLKSAARVNITMAIDILQQSLPAIGVSSPEGQAVLNSLKTLTKAFGETEQKSRQLIPAEIAQMLSALPQTNPSASMRAGAARPMPGMGAPPVNI